jgi:UDP-N-acetylmuramoyl-tripeptide--D-alanyl-D-alanine ligase
MATPIPTNRCDFTLGDVARATGGTLVGGDPNARVEGVSTDTRALAPGALFVALVGETHDGHAHLPRAVEAGAAAVLVRRGSVTPLPRVEVDDTLAALGRLARFHADRVRAARPVPSVAITGSAGKTTTKELTGAAVRALFGTTLVTQGNLNNLVGVPMTLFTLGAEHAAMVIECGTSARGEIARLGEMVAPDVGVVLNADAGHTQGLGTVEDVAVEKGALFAAATRVAVGNADDPPSLTQLARARGRTLTFGESRGADVRLAGRAVEASGRARVALELSDSLRVEGAPGTVEVSLGLLGHAAAVDAAAALAAVAAMKGAPLTSEDLARVAVAMAQVTPAPGRLNPRRVRDALVLDDTYNANPRSVRASLATAREAAEALGTRLVVVLGDMLELGDLSARLHAEVGENVVAARAAVLVTVGPQMALAARVAAAAGIAAPIVVETARTDDAATVLAGVLRPGDVVLVKGSRGMRMEQVVEALAAGAGGEG